MQGRKQRGFRSSASEPAREAGTQNPSGGAELHLCGREARQCDGPGERRWMDLVKGREESSHLMASVFSLTSRGKVIN